MGNRAEIRTGMTTRSVDGKKLGKIVDLEDWGFTIEKGLFKKKDYLAHYEDIVEVKGDEVFLGVPSSEVEHPGGRGEAGARGGAMAEAQREARARRRHHEERQNPERDAGREEAKRAPGQREPTPPTHIGEERRVPVSEEEIEVLKQRRPIGEVHLRKEVVTERRQVEVPVTREEVRVERVPVSRTGAAAGEGPSLREDEISVPIMEEEIEIRKRPVVREEIRISKEAHQEQRSATADARREEVHVKSTGRVRRTDEDDPNKRR